MNTASIFEQQPCQPDTASLQPFPCGTCGKRFTRLENLRRHVAAVHDPAKSSRSLNCPYCDTTFSRSDLRRRHVRKKHPDREPSADAQHSDDRLTKRQRQSVNDAVSTIDNIDSLPDHATTDLEAGIAAGAATAKTTSVDGESSLPWSPFDMNGLMGNTDDGSMHLSSISLEPYAMFKQVPESEPWLPDPVEDIGAVYTQESLPSQVDLFFKHVAPVFPIIHRPTFDLKSAAAPLLLAMISVSAQYGSDAAAGSEIARQAFELGRNLLRKDPKWVTGPQISMDSATTLSIVQSHLFLVLHAMVFACGAITQIGLRLHARCIEIARRAGLMETFPPRQQPTEDLEQLWRDFARAEMHKRTLFLVYQFDATWYLVLSIPRQLSHLEIKHELPCAPESWDASNASQWAFYNLTRKVASSQPLYIVAVRSAMSSASSIDVVTQLMAEPSSKLPVNYAGALMIIFFHQTSVREFTGWSTMTGRICSERFELIHKSLLAMETSVAVDLHQSPISSAAISACASWHMSMIELLLWSQPHTSGLVEGSLDAALAAATMLSSSRRLELAREVIDVLTPHISWFLLFLVKEPDVDAPSPFVTIYAFKASLIAWQLTRTGIHDFSSQLGIESLADMEEWIRNAFGKRKSWGVGRLVVQSLDELED